MRRGSDNGWIMNGDKFMGVNFGSSFVAEHEWGIGDLRKRLGVEAQSDDVPRDEYKPIRGVYGLERRRCKNPTKECIALVEEGNTLNLIVMGAYSLKHWVEDKGSLNEVDEYSFHGKEDLVTCWKEDSCLVRVKGEENFKRLRQLHEALLKGEVAVWLGGGKGLFGNSGLCLAIISEVDKESANVMYEADEDREKLEIAAEKSGIRKKIDEVNEQWQKMREVESGRLCYQNAPHSYYALSPAWANREVKSKHKVMFWLNPRHQDVNNMGWFTVEQLEQWLDYEGPILKKNDKPVPKKGQTQRKKK